GEAGGARPPPRRTRGVSRKVTAAVTSRTRRYSRMPPQRIRIGSASITATLCHRLAARGGLFDRRAAHSRRPRSVVFISGQRVRGGRLVVGGIHGQLLVVGDDRGHGAQ